MSVKGINRMVKEIGQLQRHKGRYYRKWRRNYTKWVKLTVACDDGSCEAFSRWLAGMNNYVKYKVRKHDNT
ncbi:unnamed protein product [marine sediment metagenome]|uniref:Uncharacterized protein n=1 Tax=marine sediment metagenome TaxID=412755 RepID=X1MCI9_9ZZZZ